MRFTPQEKTYELPSFGSDGEVTKKSPQNVQFLINCWGFSYDALYGERNSLTFSLGDPFNAYASFTSEKFTAVQTFDSTSTSLNSKLKPGDAILISHQNKDEPKYLDHVAIFIIDDLYFERAGTGEDVPFRLTTWEMLTSTWMPAVFDIEWTRKTQPLSPPEVAFSLTSKVTLEEFSENDDSDDCIFNDLKQSVQTMFAVTPNFDNDGNVIGQNYCWSLIFEEFEFDELTKRATPPSAFFASKLEVSPPAEIYSGLSETETLEECAPEKVCEDTQIGTTCCADGEYCYRSSVRQYHECFPLDVL
ncbi:hypothetical protein TL16_g06278 [Triparma laevis f. inornata]|uniref:Uncharacterized protein n=1 Tax=Triparma laevis f. inornata TaxID=1714386 RepID=A0A9W7ECK6_9STRA|nr:hypothetical protein TL16_g06278 [Triparma laevis f. inornata]